MANDALGNFAICTPIARAFQSLYPGLTLDFYGGTRTEELEVPLVGPDGLFSWRCSAHGAEPSEVFAKGLARAHELGGYDLVLNIEAGGLNRALAAAIGSGAHVCGPCLSPDGRKEWNYPDDSRGDLWRDKEWVSPELVARYPFLQTGFIAEVFLRLAYVEPLPDGEWPGGVPKYLFPREAPAIPVPDVLIATGGTLPSKLWPKENWIELATRLIAAGVSVGLLGAPPRRQAAFYHSASDEDALVEAALVADLRGKLTLPQVVGAVAACRLLVTIDNGILHFGSAFDVPTVGLYRPEVQRLWAPPNPNLTKVCPEGGTVADLPFDAVWRAVEGRLTSVA